MCGPPNACVGDQVFFIARLGDVTNYLLQPWDLQTLGPTGLDVSYQSIPIQCDSLRRTFASHLGGFGHHKTLPFAGLKANETNHGDLRLRPRVDAGAERHNPGRRTPINPAIAAG